MPPFKQFAATVASSLRARNCPSLRTRSGGGHEDRSKGFAFSCTRPPPGVSTWEAWELTCCVSSFVLLFVVLGVVIAADPNPDLSIRTWAHKKALERIKAETVAHQKALEWLEADTRARQNALQRIEAESAADSD